VGPVRGGPAEVVGALGVRRGGRQGEGGRGLELLGRRGERKRQMGVGKFWPREWEGEMSLSGGGGGGGKKKVLMSSGGPENFPGKIGKMRGGGKVV